MYKAKVDIGEFKKGDIVPNEKAKVWEQMYVNSPVIFISSEKGKQEDKDKKIENKKEIKPVWIDDYLNRNGNVVIKNMKQDTFSKAVLYDLLVKEEGDKNRKKVIRTIKRLINKRG